MDRNELVNKIDEIENILLAGQDNQTNHNCHAFHLTTIQFVKNYIGVETEFYKALNSYNSDNSNQGEYRRAGLAKKVLKSLKDYLSLNLDIKLTDKYQVKIDIINDFMLQAAELAKNKEFHPAAASILLGASLEEYLKKIAEKNEIDLSQVKLSIDPISKKLYEKDIITKQDLKDITSWAGIRNEATHGNFDEVNDRKRVLNAIEGVNLFMRKFEINA